MPSPVPQYRAQLASATPTCTIEAYVPAKNRHGRLLESDAWAEHIAAIEHAVCSVTGGACTSYGAQGVWRGVHEPVRVVRGSVAVAARDDAMSTLAQALGTFATATDQEVAGFTVDGIWFWAVSAQS